MVSPRFSRYIQKLKNTWQSLHIGLYRILYIHLPFGICAIYFSIPCPPFLNIATDKLVKFHHVSSWDWYAFTYIYYKESAKNVGKYIIHEMVWEFIHHGKMNGERTLKSWRWMVQICSNDFSGFQLGDF